MVFWHGSFWDKKKNCLGFIVKVFSNDNNVASYSSGDGPATQRCNRMSVYLVALQLV